MRTRVGRVLAVVAIVAFGVGAARVLLPFEFAAGRLDRECSAAVVEAVKGDRIVPATYGYSVVPGPPTTTTTTTISYPTLLPRSTTTTGRPRSAFEILGGGGTGAVRDPCTGR